MSTSAGESQAFALLYMCVCVYILNDSRQLTDL